MVYQFDGSELIGVVVGSSVMVFGLPEPAATALR
jgi:hypothetical protein